MLRSDCDCTKCLRDTCCRVTWVHTWLGASEVPDPCREGAVSERLHANYESTACAHRCFCVSCPYAITPSPLGWVHLGLALFKWQQRWRGTDAQTRRLWQRPRKPLYLPCCYSTVRRGWNSMNNACFSTRGGSAARVDVSPTDGEPATIESNGNLQEWAWGEGRVIYHAEHFTICSEEFVSSLSSQRKVTLMMPALYNQGPSSPALDYLSF